VSHELRTPLHYVRGFTTLLTRDPLTPNQARNVQDVQAASDRMLRLVEDLLDGAALQAGQLNLELRDMDYAGLVEDVLGHMRPLAEGKQLELVANVEPAGLLRADPRRIAQVLTNLLANAIKFTPHGGRIELAVRRGPGALYTEVRDSGVGISAEQLPKLFQRFSQLDMSATRPAGGSGLGLWICKGIVEAHGGRIEATSQPNVGSTFGFTLPLTA
jgi:signal transduction histidine kinase